MPCVGLAYSVTVWCWCELELIWSSDAGKLEKKIKKIVKGNVKINSFKKWHRAHSEWICEICVYDMVWGIIRVANDSIRLERSCFLRVSGSEIEHKFGRLAVSDRERENARESEFNILILSWRSLFRFFLHTTQETHKKYGFPYTFFF